MSLRDLIFSQSSVDDDDNEADQGYNNAFVNDRDGVDDQSDTADEKGGQGKKRCV